MLQIHNGNMKSLIQFIPVKHEMNKVKPISSWTWPYESPFASLKENFTK